MTFHRRFTHIAHALAMSLMPVLLFSQNSGKLITSDLLCNHIYTLASDSLKGRNTPGPGLDSAAAYIAREFSKYGIAPVEGSYYQTFFLCKKNLGETNELAITRDGVTTELKLKTGFVPYEICGSGFAEGPVVFAGYGITAPEYGYDDYAGMDVSGKAVLIFRGEPRKDDSASVFDGANNTKHFPLSEKLANAAHHGAGALLVVNGPLNFISMKPRGFPWPSLSRIIPADALPVSVCGDEDVSLPALHVGEEMVNLLFGSVDSLRRIQSRIDSLLTPASFEIPGITASIDIRMKEDRTPVQNVVGMIRGTGPEEEILVIGAHYDHVGFIQDPPDTLPDYIYNGADDNASGTAGVMAVAKAFGAMKKPPLRSVLFILFAGEEKGLFGSRYYTGHPLLPLENTVAMLNMDMISRNGSDTLFLVGEAVSPDIASIIRKENKKIRMKLLPDENFMGGSDHYPFYRKGIPFMFLFSGIHKDYHTPRDNPDRVDCNKAARVGRLAFLTALRIANDTTRYHLMDQKDYNSIFE